MFSNYFRKRSNCLFKAVSRFPTILSNHMQMLWHECKYQSCRRLLSQNIFVFFQILHFCLNSSVNIGSEIKEKQMV